MSEEIQGVVGVYVDKEGRIICTVSDFKRDAPGGFTRYEGQRARAKQALACAVVKAYCSPVVSDALDAYDCGEIVKKLNGKMTFIPVGHPDGD